MPSLGADMDAGTLAEWLKMPGDEVKRGDIVAVVETQKGAIEIEVFEPGVLDSIVAVPGERVPVGHVLARFRDVGEAPGPRAAVVPPPRPAAAVTPAPERSAAGIAVPMPQTAPAFGRVKVTPAARRLASLKRIDLSSVTPGQDGVVGLRQIEAVQLAQPPKARKRADLAEMRKAIAVAMSRSKREIPHYYVSLTMDVSPTMSWLSDRNRDRPVEQRLHYAAPLLRAVALSFRKFTGLNGHFIDGEFKAAEHVNVGMAIAMRGGGLIAPAIVETDTLDLETLMRKLNDLVKRVRSGGLRSSELSMGTVTFTNLGEDSADIIMPIIYPPQVAILGCGQIKQRPWVSDGAVAPRALMTATLAGDHRVSDGRMGAQMLAHLQSLLLKPEVL